MVSNFAGNKTAENQLVLLYYLCDIHMSWKLHLEKIIVASSIEAEYVAANMGSEVLPINKLRDYQNLLNVDTT